MATKDRLIYAPLGGAGEIGMNMYLYGYGPEGRERFILVDVGVTFPDMETTPGVDLIMADPGWIVGRADRLEAIFITHAHEDHVGALGLLWPRLQVPVHARRFTAAIAQSKMERAGLDTTVVRVAQPWPHKVEAGPFSVGFLPVSHSIPESASLVIDTPAGRILHTGDFKIDPTPVVGDPFDREAFQAVGAEGVRAMVCDSTNVFSPAPGRSEASLAEPITELMASARGLVVATTFASNVARLRTLAEAGRAAGRKVTVLGRAMNTMLRTARTAEVLDSFPPLLDPIDAAERPRESLLVLATGSQGERRAASAQLANGRYMGFELIQSDTFLFSSKTIPGNEVAVARILNALSARGVRAIDDPDDNYHVSGHPNRPDLVTMQDLVRPRGIVPMHGEHRHLTAHAELASDRGHATVVAPNGALVDLSEDTPKVIDHIETGRLYLDGTRLIGALDGVVRERVRMALRGHVAVSLMVEEGAPIGDVWVDTTGLPDDPNLRDGLAGTLEREIGHVLRQARTAHIEDDDALDALIQRTCARVCADRVGKKPVCRVMISRLDS